MALKDLPVTSELMIEILLKGRKKTENKNYCLTFIMNGIQYDQTLSKKQVDIRLNLTVNN